MSHHAGASRQKRRRPAAPADRVPSPRARVTGAPTGFRALPLDVVSHVCDFVSPDARRTLGRVCRAWAASLFTEALRARLAGADARIEVWTLDCARAVAKCTRLAPLPTVVVRCMWRDFCVDAICAFIAQCDALRTLIVPAFNHLWVTDTIYTGFRGHAQLSTLRAGAGISDASLQHISTCRNLTALDMSNHRWLCLSTAAFHALAAMPRLRDLSFERCHELKLTDEALQALAASTSLETLSLRACHATAVTDAAFTHGLAQCASLTEVDMSNAYTSAVTGEALKSMVAALPLRALSLDAIGQSSGLAQVRATIFSHCSSLSRLSISGRAVEATTALGRPLEAAAALGRLSALTHLNLNRCNVNAVDDLSRALGACGTLRVLHIDTLIRRDIQLMHLARSTTLQELHMWNCDSTGVTNTGIRAISRSHLRVLDMSRCQFPAVTDAAYAALARSPHLQTLRTHKSPLWLTDTALNALAHSTALRNLTIEWMAFPFTLGPRITALSALLNSPIETIRLTGSPKWSRAAFAVMRSCPRNMHHGLISIVLGKPTAPGSN